MNGATIFASNWLLVTILVHGVSQLVLLAFWCGFKAGLSEFLANRVGLSSAGVLQCANALL